MLNHHIDTLENGLTVIRVPMESSKSVTVMALANTGSRFEQPHQYGIAHFFEHMVFKGTQNYPDSQSLALAVDSIGANFNAFTSKEYTGYYVQSSSKHLRRALDVVSDMLLTPRLKQSDIDREKGVITEEINMYVDSPPSHIGNLYEQMVFGGSGLGHDILGTKKTVSSLKTNDFRQFLRSWYGLGNLVLVVAGNSKVVEDSKTLDLIAENFSKETEPRVKGKVDIDLYMSDKKTGPISIDRLHVENRATEQAHFVLGWPGIKMSDERRYAMTLLSTIMGGYMSSRLFTEVREKRGLCYYVNASTDQYHDGGMLNVYAGVDPKRVYQALEVVIDQMEGVADQSKKITQEELQTAKDHIAGKMALNLENGKSVAQFFGSKQLLLGEIEAPDRVLKKLNKVTLDEVSNLAGQLIKPREQRLAIIGNFPEIARFEEMISS